MTVSIKERLKGIFSEDELKKFGDEIDSIITESVNARVIDETAQIKAKYDVVAEEYCTKKILEGVEEAKGALILEYDEKMATLETKLHKELDMFLESDIIPQVSNEVILESANSQIQGNVIAGIKKLLEENHISVDSDGMSILREAKEEILNLKAEKSELLAEKMQLNERLDNVASHLLISESVQNLSDENKQRVTSMFKGKTFEEVEEKVPAFVDFLIESENKAPKADEKILNEGSELNPEPTPVLGSGDPVEEIPDLAATADRFMD